MKTKILILISLMVVFFGVIGYATQAQAQATIYLDAPTPSGPYNIGDTFDVPIRISNPTNQEIITVNIIINFDNTILSVPAGALDEAGTSFPGMILENIVSGGRIDIVAVSFTGVTGADLLVATIPFQTVAAGSANVNFASIAFNDESCYVRTTTANNILSSTTGGTYTVGVQTTASLTVSPSSGSHEVGQTFSVNINLNTGGQDTDGADAHLEFNPLVLEVQLVTPGSLYPSTDINTHNNTAGTIVFSQTTSGNEIFNDSGVLATINFLAKGVGVSKLDFDFTPGAITDSNVSKAGGTHEDILDRVANGSYTVTAAADTTPPGNVTNFTATAGDGQVLLSWSNPADADFQGTKICYSTSAGLSNAKACTALTGCSANSCVHTSLTNDTTFYYTAFSYDEVPNYASGAQASAMPQAVIASLGISLQLEGREDAEKTVKDFTSSLDIYFLTPGTETEIYTASGNADVAGNASFSIPMAAVPANNYDIRVAVPYRLTKRLTNVSWSSSGVTVDFGNILAGNLQDNDNIINSLDWSYMASKWMSNDPIANIVPDDLFGAPTSQVNTLDWHYMNQNWGLTGQ